MAESASGAESEELAGDAERPAKRQRRSSRAAPVTAQAAGDSDTRRVSARTSSVCKLFVKKVPCNFADPWRKHSQVGATGTGFLVGGRWIVTNAHVVHRAVSVLVRATTGPPVKYRARVQSVGLPCDLAVLCVDDESFWQGKESLQLSQELPRLDDNVTCIGFPVGGENISVTRGVVSRVDVNMDGLLRIQIDAAINPGNSGGPVVGPHGTVVGVAASHLKHASNIGYIIPTAVLEQFLSCIDSASGYTGVASLGIGRVQTLESPALRRQLGLKEGFNGGVRVSTVYPMGPSLGKLRENDVIISVDGVEIGQDATVPLRDNERIHFLHLVTQRLAGRDCTVVRVWRGDAEVDVEVELQPDRWLVPRMDGYDAAPEYVIVGGLVFVPLSHPWAELKGNDKNARSLIHQNWGSALPEEGQQVVILSKVLAHPCNVGYHSLHNVVLDTFGGRPVRNVAGLAAAVAACEDPALVFEFLRVSGHGKELVVLNRAECQASEPEVLTQHLIAAPCMVRRGGRGEPRPLSPAREHEGGGAVPAQVAAQPPAEPPLAIPAEAVDEAKGAPVEAPAGEDREAAGAAT